MPGAAAEFAARLASRYGLGPTDLVIELGGSAELAGALHELGVRPSTVPAPDQLHQQTPGTARLVLCHDGLGASANPHAFLRGLELALADDGVAVIEVPSLLAMHEGVAYDAICHELLCYYSVTQVANLAQRHGLELVDAEPRPDHPLTLRLTLQRHGGPLFARPAVDELIARERTEELDRADAWMDFAHLAEISRDLLASELEEVLYRSRTVAAWSRGGRGLSALSYCGNPALRLAYVVDECQALHGLMTPGHRIPIVDAERLRREPPELVVLLGRDWDPTEDSPLTDFWRRGGRVLVMAPRPHDVDPAPEPYLAGRLIETSMGDTIVPGLWS
jgi:hypothetical protein